jgi:poly(beta-D-mannuronate) lyase
MDIDKDKKSTAISGDARSGDKSAKITSKNGVKLGSTTIDMTGSGYDVEDDYMYFKAGLYTQNHTGEPDDYDQATFYALENTHQGYDH